MCNEIVPQRVKTNPELQQVFLRVSKILLLNEFEFINLSIYLDKLGWELGLNSIEEYLSIVGLAIKVTCI